LLSKPLSKLHSEVGHDYEEDLFWGLFDVWVCEMASEIEGVLFGEGVIDESYDEILQEKDEEEEASSNNNNSLPEDVIKPSQQETINSLLNSEAYNETDEEEIDFSPPSNYSSKANSVAGDKPLPSEEGSDGFEVIPSSKDDNVIGDNLTDESVAVVDDEEVCKKKKKEKEKEMSSLDELEDEIYRELNNL